MRLKLKMGKGVLSKDGKTPFAPGTLHYSKDGWHCPADLTWKNLATLIEAMLTDESYTEIQLIDHDNTQYTWTRAKR
jgi:hypothetical protein